MVHPFDVGTAEARQLQLLLRSQVADDTPLALASVEFVLGTDVSYIKSLGLALAAAVCCRLPGMEVVEEVVAEVPLAFPYVPGLLAFREVPALLPVLERLTSEPGLVVVDGQGQAHPLGIGLASHLGLLLGRPTIGCAKSVLVGEYEAPPARRGGKSPMLYRGRRVGYAVRTRDGVRPVFVSVGHRIDLESSVSCVLGLTRGYRLPEPQRLAHLACERRKRVLAALA